MPLPLLLHYHGCFYNLRRCWFFYQLVFHTFVFIFRGFRSEYFNIPLSFCPLFPHSVIFHSIINSVCLSLLDTLFTEIHKALLFSGGGCSGGRCCRGSWRCSSCGLPRCRRHRYLRRRGCRLNTTPRSHLPISTHSLSLSSSVILPFISFHLPTLIMSSVVQLCRHSIRLFCSHRLSHCPIILHHRCLCISLVYYSFI